MPRTWKRYNFPFGQVISQSAAWTFCYVTEWGHTWTHADHSACHRTCGCFPKAWLVQVAVDCQGLKHTQCAPHTAAQGTTATQGRTDDILLPTLVARKCTESFTKDNGWLSYYLPLFVNIPVSDLGIHIETIDKYISIFKGEVNIELKAVDLKRPILKMTCSNAA